MLSWQAGQPVIGGIDHNMVDALAGIIGPVWLGYDVELANIDECREAIENG